VFKTKSQKDFFAAIMFMVMGLAFAIGARNYNMGDSTRMGPGYFPFVLGLLLVFLGALVLMGSFRSTASDGDRVGRFAWKPLLYIIVANLVFGVCLGGLKLGGQTVLPPLGLVLGTYALVLIASRASNEFKWLPSLISATVLAVGCYLVFIVLLKLQLPVWPSFMTA
jgi:Tripartite tricarboxylate transporter TctB family